MDIFKFIILSMACLSGFMVISYQGIAQQRGWPVGSMLNIDRMGYVPILGFICQWGSVIISFFVNPWWSAFLVLFVGFIGNMILTNIFKSFTQIISIPLLIGSFILVSFFVIPSTSLFQSSALSGSQSFKHFSNSIGYANQATELKNSFPTYELADEDELEKVVELKKNALREAELVDVQILNNQIVGFREHFTNEYILGLKYFIEGHDEKNNSKIIQSYKLHYSWGLWYDQNFNKF